MAGRFSIEAVFKAVDRVTAPVSRMQNRVGKFTRSMSRGFRRVEKAAISMARGIKRGMQASTVALVAFGAAAINVIGVGAEFGRAIGSAAAKFPEQIQRGTQAFKDLEEAARAVGRTTEFTSTQAAQALNFLAKAGFSAEFSMRILGDVVDFATASEIGLAEAADIASDALGAFGLDSKDVAKKLEGMRRVMDVMSLTANSTNVNVSELFESIRDGAPIAATAGVSVETFAAAMGFLASNGIKASKAGTAAKNITLALAGVGNKAAEVFQKLGISLADNNGKLRDQFDVMDDLRAKLKSFTQQEQVGLMTAIFGKIPIAAASKLLADTTGKVRELRKEFENASGSAQRTAAFIRDDVKGSLDGLNSAVESVKISIFSLQEGPLKEAVDRMTDWVRANEEAIATGIGDFILLIADNFEEIVSTIASVAKGIAVFIALTLVLKTIIGVLTVINLLMAANPLTLMVLGVLALIAAGVALVTWIDDISAGFDKLPAAIKFVLLPLNLMIKAIKFLKDNAGVITGAASKLGGFLGFGGADETEAEAAAAAAPTVVSPQERVARSIEERRETSTAEVTIRDETQRAEVTGGKLGPAVQLLPSGAL